MSVRRCMMDRASLQATELVVTDSSTLNYLHKALRVRPGQAIEFLDGKGGARRAEVEQSDKRRLVGGWLEVYREEPRRGPAGPIPVLARLKGGDEEDAISALAALGLPEIRIFQAEREPLGRTEPGHQAQRWRRISQDSCRQSGAYWSTEIHWFASLKEALDGIGSIVFGDVQGTAMRPQPCIGLGVVTGPEGGFSEAERAWLLAQGATAVSLGRHVLRARHAASLLPTAALALEGVQT